MKAQTSAKSLAECSMMPTCVYNTLLTFVPDLQSAFHGLPSLIDFLTPAALPCPLRLQGLAVRVSLTGLPLKLQTAVALPCPLRLQGSTVRVRLTVVIGRCTATLDRCLQLLGNRHYINLPLPTPPDMFMKCALKACRAVASQACQSFGDQGCCTCSQAVAHFAGLLQKKIGKRVSDRDNENINFDNFKEKIPY